MMVEKAVRAAAVAVLLPSLHVLAGCNDIEIGDVVGVDGIAAELTGFWVGVGEVTTREDRVGAAAGPGFQFPIALELREDRTFDLWTAHFPVDGGAVSQSRNCSGVYAVQARTMSLFTDRLCRALPLSRYTVRRTGVGRILLEAAGAEPGGDAASVRVRLALERVEVPSVGIDDADED